MWPSTCRKEGRNSNCKLLLENESSLRHREIIGIETQDAVVACMKEPKLCLTATATSGIRHQAIQSMQAAGMFNNLCRDRQVPGKAHC